ncbi:uncharacterized protein [Eurosta solidaginis]|uniref:uncharacterized protein n=1 Tax=Eurosta solidaginis TaxID=178769 RepID=UPI0035307BC2
MEKLQIYYIPARNSRKYIEPTALGSAGQIMPPTQPRQAPMPSRPPMPDQPPIPGHPGYNQPPAPGTGMYQQPQQYAQAQRRLDPDQMPNPISVIIENQSSAGGAFIIYYHNYFHYHKQILCTGCLLMSTEHHLHSELRVLRIMEGVQDFGNSISKILRTSSTWIEGRSPLYRNANNESHFGESHYSNNSHFSGRPQNEISNLPKLHKNGIKCSKLAKKSKTVLRRSNERCIELEKTEISFIFIKVENEVSKLPKLHKNGIKCSKLAKKSKTVYDALMNDVSS